MKTLTQNNLLFFYKHFFVLFTFLIVQAKAQNTGGQLSGGMSVCANMNVGTLNLTSFNGVIKRWETSINPGGPWSTMSYTLPFYTYSNLSQSLWFRVVTQVLNFSENYSNAQQIICQAAAASPVIAGPSQLCPSVSASASLVAGSSAGLIWEYSSNNWQTIIPIGAVSPLTINLSSVIPPYQLRVSSSDGICPTLLSNTLSVSAAQQTSAGGISGASAICSAANALTLSLGGHTGAVLNWESSASLAGPFSLINGSAGLTLLPVANLLQTTYFRATVQNQGCLSATSPIHTLLVQATSVAGFIAGTPSLCSGSNSGSLILLGHTGNLIQWQRSSNLGQSWSAAAGNGTLLSINNLNASSLFRALVQNGSCPSAASNSHTLQIQVPPTAAFNFSNVCSGAALNFTNICQSPSTHLWQFGDGNSSPLFSPMHIYNQAGQYTVSLFSTALSGCRDSTSAQITIYPLPVTSILSSNANCVGSNLQFVSTATIASGTINGASFNFNDGSPTVNAAIVSHSFASSGIFNMSLSVLSNFGCMSSITRSITIYPKPVPAFRIVNTCAKSKVELKDESQINSGSFSYRWQFGNGDSSSSSSPQYLYSQAGTYFIKLTLLSDKGCSDSKIKPITIHPLPTAFMSSVSACAKASLTLAAQISNTAIVKNARLDFGDGSSFNYWQGQHTYQQPGFYSLQLELESDSGCRSISTQTVLIYPKPLALFVSFPACEDQTVTLQNYSSLSSGSLSFLWSVDTLRSKEQQPSFALTKAGTYILKQLVVSDKNCRDSSSVQLVVNSAPKINFITDSRCQLQTGSFQSLSELKEGAITMTNWAFGDLSFGNGWEVKKVYETSGVYTVTLYCSSDKDCSATLSKTIEIFPTVRATFSQDLFCEGQNNQLINTSRNETGSFTSRWFIAPDQFYSSNNLNILHLKPGRHDIQLSTKSDSGCSDSVRHPIFIYPAPDLKLIADTLVELGEEITLQASGASSYTWFPDTYLSSPMAAKTFCKPDSAIHYRCFAISENGCLSSKELSIMVRKEHQLLIYNVITPDGNGLNDTWQIDNIQAYADNRVHIFDQWNKIVFEQTNYQNDWDGRNQSGELLPPGTYFYQITFTSSKVTYRGYLSLLLTN